MNNRPTTNAADHDRVVVAIIERRWESPTGFFPTRSVRVNHPTLVARRFVILDDGPRGPWVFSSSESPATVPERPNETFSGFSLAPTTTYVCR